MSVPTEAASRVIYPQRHGERSLTVEDLWAIPRVTSCVPAPGGELAAVTVARYDMEENEGRSRIWRVPTAGGEPHPLTAAGFDSSQPAFSPDGGRLAFVRRTGGETVHQGDAGRPHGGRKERERAQLYLMPTDGGEAERLTDLPLGVTDPRWLPDGSGIVFLGSLLDGHLTPEATRAELARREEDPVKAHVTEQRVYRFWDRFLTDGRVPHLFLLDLASGALRDLTPGSRDWFGLMELEGTWDLSPDGEEIAYTVVYAEGDDERLKSALFTVPVAGGTPARLTDAGVNKAMRPRYSPDGAALVYGLTVDPYFYADRVRLMRYDRKLGGHAELLTGWDRSPSEWEHCPDGELVFKAEDDGRGCLFSCRPGDREPRRRTDGGTVSSLRPGDDGALYFTRQTLQDPAEAYRMERDGKPERLTSFTAAALAGVTMSEVREVVFTGADAERVQMYVLMPPDAEDGKRYPLVQMVHGGPHGITADSFHPRWNAQLFAAPGYVVAAVNFQGSTSRGQDFAKRIQGEWGRRPYVDVMAATDLLIADGLVDGERMAAAGGSYGGYLVGWIASRTDRFRCIVNHAGAIDLLSMYATDVTHARGRSFGGDPWTDLEAIDRYNPVRHTASWTTPTLVIHGEKDYRVPVTQGLLCYNLLKAKGVEARLVYYPDENHWVLKPQNARLWYREVHAWLARFLQI